MDGTLPAGLATAAARHAELGGVPADDLVEALRDERVARTLALALRDVRLRRRYAALRAEGVARREAVEALRGPHWDPSGRRYYLSYKGVEKVLGAWRGGNGRGA